MLVLHCFQVNIQGQSMTLREVLFFTSDISCGKRRKFDELFEKAQDLLLEIEQLKSIAYIRD